MDVNTDIPMKRSAGTGAGAGSGPAVSGPRTVSAVPRATRDEAIRRAAEERAVQDAAQRRAESQHHVTNKRDPPAVSRSPARRSVASTASTRSGTVRSSGRSNRSDASGSARPASPVDLSVGGSTPGRRDDDDTGTGGGAIGGASPGRGVSAWSPSRGRNTRAPRSPEMMPRPVLDDSVGATTTPRRSGGRRRRDRYDDEAQAVRLAGHVATSLTEDTPPQRRSAEPPPPPPADDDSSSGMSGSDDGTDAVVGSGGSGGTGAPSAEAVIAPRGAASSPGSKLSSLFAYLDEVQVETAELSRGAGGGRPSTTDGNIAPDDKRRRTAGIEGDRVPGEGARERRFGWEDNIDETASANASDTATNGAASVYSQLKAKLRAMSVELNDKSRTIATLKERVKKVKAARAADKEAAAADETRKLTAQKKEYEAAIAVCCSVFLFAVAP